MLHGGEPVSSTNLIVFRYNEITEDSHYFFAYRDKGGKQGLDATMSTSVDVNMIINEALNLVSRIQHTPVRIIFIPYMIAVEIYFTIDRLHCVLVVLANGA